MSGTKNTPATATAGISPRKAEITAKALRLFVEHGYDETSVEDIAQACDMSKGNFYHYFDSKEDLIYLVQGELGQVQKDEFARLMPELQGIGARKALKCFTEAYYHHVDRNQDAFNFLNHVVVQLGREGRRRIFQGSLDVQKLFERLILEGIGQGVFKGVHAKLVAHNIVRLGAAWANNRWQLRRFFTIDDYIAEQLKFIFEGIDVDVRSNRWFPAESELGSVTHYRQESPGEGKISTRVRHTADRLQRHMRDGYGGPPCTRT